MPQSTSLASLAMLQQTSWALRDTFDDLYRAHEGWGRRVNRIKALYEVLELENQQPEGTHVYPLQLEKRDGTEGMGIEFRSVTDSNV